MNPLKTLIKNHPRAIKQKMQGTSNLDFAMVWVKREAQFAPQVISKRQTLIHNLRSTNNQLK